MADRSGRDLLFRRFRAALARERAALHRALTRVPRRQRAAAATLVLHRLLAIRMLTADLAAHLKAGGLGDLFAGRLPGFSWLEDVLIRQPIDTLDLAIDAAALERLLAFFAAPAWRLGQPGGVDAAMLGALFESHINQKELGAYYTRDDITTYIVQRTVLPWLLERLGRPADDAITANTDLLGPTLTFLGSGTPAQRARARAALKAIAILDPTCGSGAFLLAAGRLLEQLWTALGRPQEARIAWRRNLFGIDLMPEAVELCRLLLRTRHVDAGPGIAVGNVLESLPWPDPQAFDIIIGNPPYLPARAVDYSANGFATAACPDVYAWVLERSAGLLREGGRCGMIVPLSLAFSERFAACRQMLFERYQGNWFASFGRIPDALFNFDVRVRNTIHLGRVGAGEPRCYSTPLQRWFEAERPTLFSRLVYTACTPALWQGRVPRCGRARLTAALEDRLRQPARLGDALARRPTRFPLHFKKTAYNWLTFCRRLPPCFDAAGRPIPHTQFDTWYFPTARLRDLAFLFLNGKWAFAWWCMVGDDFHVTRWMLESFPINLAGLPAGPTQGLLTLVPRLETALRQAIHFKHNAGKRVGTFNLARCRSVTDRSDRLFGEYLGLGDVWEDVEMLCRRIIKTDFGDG